MRRSVDQLAVLVATTLAIGCTPEAPTMPRPAPVQLAPTADPVPGKVPGPAPRKKKEPGLGGAMPKASVQARSTR